MTKARKTRTILHTHDADGREVTLIPVTGAKSYRQQNPNIKTREGYAELYREHAEELQARGVPLTGWNLNTFTQDGRRYSYVRFTNRRKRRMVAQAILKPAHNTGISYLDGNPLNLRWGNLAVGAGRAKKGRYGAAIVQPSSELLLEIEAKLQDENGTPAREVIRQCLAMSVESHIAVANDAPVALFGLAETGDCGVPWMLNTRDFDPKRFETMQQGRKVLDGWNTRYRALISVVPEQETKAQRWLLSMGFVEKERRTMPLLGIHAPAIVFVRER